MNFRKSIVMGLLLVCCAYMFADNEAFLDIGKTAKTTTTVYVPSKDKTLSLEDAIEFAMVDAEYYGDASYDIKIYGNKTELLTSKDFSDEYIYGTATMAVVNLNYGVVQITYYRYDNEVENIVGWDHLGFFVLNDGRVICEKILFNSK